MNFLLSASVTPPMKWGCESQTLQDMNSAWPTVDTEKIFFINQFIYSIFIVYTIIYIYISLFIIKICSVMVY